MSWLYLYWLRSQVKGQGHKRTCLCAWLYELTWLSYSECFRYCFSHNSLGEGRMVWGTRGWGDVEVVSQRSRSQTVPVYERDRMSWRDYRIPNASDIVFHIIHRGRGVGQGARLGDMWQGGRVVTGQRSRSQAYLFMCMVVRVDIVFHTTQREGGLAFRGMARLGRRIREWLLTCLCAWSYELTWLSYSECFRYCFSHKSQ